MLLHYHRCTCTPFRASPRTPRSPNASSSTSDSLEDTDSRLSRSPKPKKGRAWSRRSEGEEEEEERPNFFDDVEEAMDEEMWESPDVLMKNLKDRVMRYVVEYGRLPSVSAWLPPGLTQCEVHCP